MSRQYKVGTITLRQKNEFTERFEVARWYRAIECQPQKVDLYYSPDGNNDGRFFADFRGICSGSDFTSLFAGSAVGSNKTDTEVGKEFDFHWSVDGSQVAQMIYNSSVISVELDLKTIDIRFKLINTEQIGNNPLSWPARTFIKTDIALKDEEYLSMMIRSFASRLKDSKTSTDQAYWMEKRAWYERLLTEVNPHWNWQERWLAADNEEQRFVIWLAAIKKIDYYGLSTEETDALMSEYTNDAELDRLTQDEDEARLELSRLGE